MSKIPPSAKILFEEAVKENLNPRWETDYGLFSFQYKNKIFFIYLTKLPINNTLGNWITQDKFATRVVLEKFGLPNIPYCFTNDIKVANTFFDKYKKIIAKPVLGEQSKDVILVENSEQMKHLKIKETIFEKYIEGTEYRYLVLQNTVTGAQRKELRPIKKYPWRKFITNLEEREYDKSLIKLSLNAAQIVNQKFLAVDFIIDKNGDTFILELNSMSGLYSWHNPDSGKPKNIARLILKAVVDV